MSFRDSEELWIALISTNEGSSSGNEFEADKNIYIYYALGKELEDLEQWTRHSITTKWREMRQHLSQTMV